MPASPIRTIPQASDNLDALNAGERRALMLLAEGHTVKSIANLTGATVPSVNERLRSARRKSGIGSSRELARLLAQKNQPKEIGLADADPAVAPFVAEGPPDAGRRRKVLVMTTILIAASVAAAIALQPAPSADNDPMIGNVLGTSDLKQVLGQFQSSKSREDYDRVLASEGSQSVLRQLHAQVRSEAPDPAWSAKTTTALSGIFAQVPSVNAKPGSLRVLCSASLCEVTVRLPAKKMARDGELFLPEFQDRAQDAAVERNGVKLINKLLTSSDPGYTLYLSYWERI